MFACLALAALSLVGVHVHAAPLSGRAPQLFSVPVNVQKNGLLDTLLDSTGLLGDIVSFEQNRAAMLKSNAKGTVHTIPAINYQYYQYTAIIGVGKPPTSYNLVIDTGSSNTFVGTGKSYVRTSTSVATKDSVDVTYGSGYFSGNEYLDQVTIGPGFVITNQSIGDALQFADFPGVDGIIGVGPTDLTQGTLDPDLNALIPTVVDTAYKQGLIPAKILGIEFAPTTSNESFNGALTFGGVEPAYANSMTYTPVTTTYPSNYYWGINVTELIYGKNTTIFKNDAGIVDTGTTLIYIADDFFAKYQAAIPGSQMSEATGMLQIPASSVNALKDLNFVIGGKEFTLSASAQLVPQAEVVAYGGQLGQYFSYIGPLGSPSGEGLDFIIGQKFLERFYSVFDGANNRVGFSYTEYTYV